MHIRIFTPHGFVFDIPLNWVVSQMRGVDESEVGKGLMRDTHLTAIEYLKSLSWTEIVHKLKFMGMIDDVNHDSLADSVFDIPEKPLNYKKTKQNQFKLYLTTN
jgi:hypothetical protein